MFDAENSTLVMKNVNMKISDVVSASVPSIFLLFSPYIPFFTILPPPAFILILSFSFAFPFHCPSMAASAIIYIHTHTHTHPHGHVSSIVLDDLITPHIQAIHACSFTPLPSSSYDVFLVSTIIYRGLSERALAR